MPEIKAKGDWWEVREPRALAGDNLTTDIYVYGDIGESWYDESITASEFVEQLQKIDSDSIDLHINSYGGSVADGLAIYNTVRQHRASVNTFNDGVAMSIASLILMAGDTVNVAENSITMIHAPWTVVGGNAPELREAADVLDTYAKSMASAYSRNGFSTENALLLLQDGKDHTYTADEAQALGIVDNVTQAFAAAATYRKNRFTTPIAAPAAHTKVEDVSMPDKNPTTPDAAESKPEALTDSNVADIKSAAAVKVRAQIAKRNTQLKTIKAMTDDKRVKDLVDTVIADPDKTMEDFYTAADEIRGQGIEPINKPRPEHVDSPVDARDKYREGAGRALAFRMGIDKDDRGNEFRGRSLSQLAEIALVQAGHHVRGLTKSEIAKRVLASHSTSDFPLLLADAANKRLQAAYEEEPSSWADWCATGETSDFKTVNLLRMGSFNSLDVIPEGQEYTQGTITEEREQLTPYTVGKYIQMTRQMIVNDDLQAFARMASILGAAAGRTVNEDVYAALIANADMSDGVDLFHADHNNLAGTGTALSVASLGVGRSAMRKQKGPGGTGRALNIIPTSLIVPVALEDSANVINASEFDPDDTGNTRSPNPQRNRYNVVSDPLLDETSVVAWYLAAASNRAPLMEVHFLDGNQSPRVDDEEEFLTDAVRWKVALDYGVKANDWRGGYRNPGPA